MLRYAGLSDVEAVSIGAQPVTYQSREDYLGQTAVLWSKETAPGHQLAPSSR